MDVSRRNVVTLHRVGVHLTEMDNVMVERLWRSLKYEEVYLKSYESVDDARRSISKYLHFFNQGRKHQSLGERTPDELYYESQMRTKAA